MKSRLFAVFAAALALLLASCSRETGSGIQIENAWGRASPQSAENAAFYLTIQNTGSEADALIGAQSPACGMTELHETSMDAQSLMQMHPVERIEIPAGEQVELKVGGLHVMCMHKQADFASGAKISLTLLFEKAGEQTIEVEIREP
jgi:hypothetical protein